MSEKPSAWTSAHEAEGALCYVTWDWKRDWCPQGCCVTWMPFAVAVEFDLFTPPGLEEATLTYLRQSGVRPQSGPPTVHLPFPTLDPGDPDPRAQS